jgi:FkbM family methyltransferase
LLTLAPERSAVLVEATPTAAGHLWTKFASDRRVVVHPVAVGAEDGSASLHIFNAGGNFNSLLPGSDDLEPWYKVEERDTVTVPVRTLDGLLGSEDVALLKLDVQGVESAVLRGAEDTLTRTRAVYIETNFASHYQGDSLFPPTPRGSESWFRLHDIGRPYHDWNGCTLWCDLLYARST